MITGGIRPGITDGIRPDITLCIPPGTIPGTVDGIHRSIMAVGEAIITDIVTITAADIIIMSELQKEIITARMHAVQQAATAEAPDRPA
jgi:hypothetical protein